MPFDRSKITTMPLRVKTGISTAVPREFKNRIYELFETLPLPSQESGEDYSAGEQTDMRAQLFVQLLIKIADEGGTARWQEWTEYPTAYWYHDNERQSAESEFCFADAIATILKVRDGTEDDEAKYLTLQEVSRIYADETIEALGKSGHQTSWWIKYGKRRQLEARFGFPAASYAKDVPNQMNPSQLQKHAACCAQALRPRAGNVEDPGLYAAALDGVTPVNPTFKGLV